MKISEFIARIESDILPLLRPFDHGKSSEDDRSWQYYVELEATLRAQVDGVCIAMIKTGALPADRSSDVLYFAFIRFTEGVIFARLIERRYQRAPHISDDSHILDYVDIFLKQGWQDYVRLRWQAELFTHYARKS